MLKNDDAFFKLQLILLTNFLDLLLLLIAYKIWYNLKITWSPFFKSLVK